MSVDIKVMIGGEAGQGVQSAGYILAKALARGGFHIFADQDYESRVRGGHNFFRVRASDGEVGTFSEVLDILVAFNSESIELHQKELAGKGVVVFNGDKIKDIEVRDNFFTVPMEQLAEESAKNKLMSNTVALGVVLGLAGYDLKILDGVLLKHFGAGDAGKANVAAAKSGYEYARSNFKGSFGQALVPVGESRKMLLTGNEAIALGAIAAGCKFVSAYPMTPATSILEYMAGKADDLGMVVVQPEDEISAVNMTIGASYAGVRAMTATSGSGFCLMAEGLGLAGMTETPLVVVNAQRPGPAIGLPTRTEQGDLQFILHAHHGDFPRAVLAPGTVTEAFWLTVKAFNLAEKYQLPVIILTDEHLASSYATIDRFDLSKVNIDRGLLFSAEEGGKPEYKRYRMTASGISPRAFPGQKGVLVVADSDEHNEDGHLIEDAGTRTRMMQKRMQKLSGLKQEVASPQLYGPGKAKTTLIGWGSTYGAICEAVNILNKEGMSVNSLHLTELWPFPAGEVARVLDDAQSCYVVESNATGQLHQLIQAETGKSSGGKILKYDGRPFTPADIVQQVKKEGR